MNIYKFFLFLTTQLIFLYNALSLELISLDPNIIYKNFASEIEVHHTDIGVKFDKNYTTNDIMLHIGFLELPYDRIPPEYGYIYCKNKHGQLVKDLSYQEEFYYSCCKFKYNKNMINYYICPIPPANIDPDPIRTLFNDDINSILLKLVSNETNWEISNKKMIYTESKSITGFFKKIFVFIIILSISYTIIGYLMEIINFFSNKYPLFTLINHLLCTFFIIIYQIFILININYDDENKNILAKGAISYSLLSLYYSLFIIYIPEKKDISDKKSIDQRITFYDYKKISLIILFLKKKIIRDICSLIFFSLNIYHGFTVYILIDTTKEFFDADWQMLLFISIIYIGLSIIFLAAFLTGIYEVKIPIQFDKKDGNIIKVIPKSIQRREKNYKKKKTVDPMLKDEIKNNKINNFMGLCKNDKVEELDNNKILNNELFAIDTDYMNKDTPFFYLFWRIGKIDKSQIILNNQHCKEFIKKGFVNKSYGILKLKYRENNKIIKVYKSIKIDDSNKYKYKFLEFGYIKDDYLYKENKYIQSFLAYIFRLIPDGSDEFQYNVIENLRLEMYLITRKYGKSYGKFYWISMLLVTIISLLFEIIYSKNIFNIFIIFVMIVFSIIVNTKVVSKPKIKSIKNYKALYQRLKSNTRSSDTINKYSLNKEWLISTNNKVININDKKIIKNINYNDFKLIILEDNLPDKFFYKVNINSCNNILGFGIGNDLNNMNIFKIFSLAMWISLSDNSTCIGSYENLKWDNNNGNKILYMGKLNNKIIFIFPNGKVFCSNYKEGPIILCVFNNSNIEITKYELNLNNDFICIPSINYNYKKNILLKFNNENNRLIVNSNNWNSKVEMIDNRNNLCYYYIYKSLLNKKGLNINYEVIDRNKNNNKCSKKIILNDIKFNKFVDPFQCNFKIIFSDINNLPDFIALGIVEEKFILYKGGIDIVPGWIGSNSIGFHSDDGSICISNMNNSIYKENKDLIWFNKEKEINISIGYDGDVIYFVLNNNRISIKNLIPNDWDKGLNFFPILYFNNNFSSNFELLINL
jgi:hypothetical protein